MPENENKYIPLYYSYIEQLKLLPDEQIGQLVMALLLYGRDGTLPNFPQDSSMYMAFSFIADNSKRAKIRGMEASEKRRIAGRKGGQSTAAKAQRNEKGEFITLTDQANPSKTKQTQATQAYNNNLNNKDNNKNNNNLLQSGPEDCFEDSRVVSYYTDMIGALSQNQTHELIKLGKEMGDEAVVDAITIAYEHNAQSWDYVRKVINTKQKHPNYRPCLGEYL